MCIITIVGTKVGILCATGEKFTALNEHEIKLELTVRIKILYE